MKVNIRRVFVVEYSADVETDDLAEAMRSEREYVPTPDVIQGLAGLCDFEQTSVRVWLDAEGAQ